jgi:hypothetical protein
LGRGDERLAVLGSASELTAMTIVVNRRPGIWETFQPSQMPLGAWVMRPGMEYVTAGRGLLRALPGWGQLLAITQQDPAIHLRPPHGPTLLTVDYIKTGWVALEGDFEGYWKARGKGLRQNMRTQRSRLARESTAARLEIVTDASKVEIVLDIYARLESSGWKGGEGTAVRLDTSQGQFYVDMLREYCAAGLGRLCVYWFGERPVAVDLHIEHGDTIVLLKTTYDESVQGLSPSSMLREDLLKLLFDERRIKRMEFYGPAMDWTFRWTDNVRTLFHVNVYRSAAVCSLRQWVRSRGRSAGTGS